MKVLTAIVIALLLTVVAVSAKPVGMTAEQFHEYRGYDTDRPEIYCPLRAPTESRLGSVGTWGALSNGEWICGNWGRSKTAVVVEAVSVPVESVCTEKCVNEEPVCIDWSTHRVCLWVSAHGHYRWECFYKSYCAEWNTPQICTTTCI